TDTTPTYTLSLHDALPISSIVTTWIEPENSDGCASRSLIAMAGCWPEVTACWISCASDVVVAVTDPSPSSLVSDEERQVVAHERSEERRVGKEGRAGWGTW